MIRIVFHSIEELKDYLDEMPENSWVNITVEVRYDVEQGTDESE